MEEFLMNDIFSTIGNVASILSVIYAFYSLRKLKRSIRIGFLMDVRRMIDAIEQDKAPFTEKDRNAYDILFRIQGELETIYNKLLETFSIKDLRKSGQE